MKIGIVVAMEAEAKPFLAAHRHTTEQVGTVTVYQWKMSGNEVYLARPMTVGEICAASATQMLVSKYGVEAILNFGVVGALEKDVALLSTVLVGSVVHYQMDTTAFEDVRRGEYAVFDDVAVKTDETLLAAARRLDPSLPVVRCASGDKFVDLPQEKAALAAEFGAQICDMESAGILITCKINGLPALIVKVVSDSLTGGGREFSENVALASEKFVALVDGLLQTLTA